MPRWHTKLGPCERCWSLQWPHVVHIVRFRRSALAACKLRALHRRCQLLSVGDAYCWPEWLLGAWILPN